MTVDDIKTTVATRLNLTSSDAYTRIVSEINDRYKRVTSSIGLAVTRRQTFSANAGLGSNLMTFSGCEKLINVVDRSTSPYRVLQEISMEEMENREPAANDFVTYYAIQTMGASSVVIRMDCIAQSAFTLYADGYANLATISGSSVPAFAESFHDILVHGVLADEYRKIMQKALAIDEEQQYERRLGELRLFIAESAYLERYQGKNTVRSISTGVPGAGGGGSSFDGSQSWTQTGLITFNRTSQAVGSRAPFAVASGSERVTNLKVDTNFLEVQVFS
jgi:hypothetical protein